jgi:hypothetical protein
MATTILDKHKALHPTATEAQASAALESTLQIALAASADAATTLAAGELAAVGETCEVVASYHASATSGASNASNYAIVTLSKWTAASAGTISSVIATFATSAAAIVANQAKALTIATSMARLAVGDVLRVSVDKAGSGLSTAAGTVTVRVRRLD